MDRRDFLSAMVAASCASPLASFEELAVELKEPNGATEGFSFDLDNRIVGGSVERHFLESGELNADYVDNSPNAKSNRKSQDLTDQFLIFQISRMTGGGTIMNPHEVVPNLADDTKADVLMKAQLESFNIGTKEKIDRGTRATLRMSVGKDPSSSNTSFDTAHWAVTTALKLFDPNSNKIPQANDLKSDFNVAFCNRPIEVPGGLGVINFEVFRHREPQWWQQMFQFIAGPTGKALAASLGFPALTNSALQYVDEMTNKLTGGGLIPLFRSRPTTYALTKKAKFEYEGSNTAIQMGVLNPGFWVFVRGKDLNSMIEMKPRYLASYGILAPESMTNAQIASGEVNPLNVMTYAIIKIEARQSTIVTASSL